MAKNEGIQFQTRNNLVAAGMVGAMAGVVAAAVADPAQRKKITNFIKGAKDKAEDLKEQAIEASKTITTVTHDGSTAQEQNGKSKPNQKKIA